MNPINTPSLDRKIDASRKRAEQEKAERDARTPMRAAGRFEKDEHLPSGVVVPRSKVQTRLDEWDAALRKLRQENRNGN